MNYKVRDRDIVVASCACDSKRGDAVRVLQYTSKRQVFCPGRRKLIIRIFLVTSWTLILVTRRVLCLILPSGRVLHHGDGSTLDEPRTDTPARALRRGAAELAKNAKLLMITCGAEKFER